MPPKGDETAYGVPRARTRARKLVFVCVCVYVCVCLSMTLTLRGYVCSSGSVLVSTNV